MLRCFIVRKFMSRNRSTQLARQASSARSSLAFLTLPVTHFFQQICVRLCVSAVAKHVSQGSSPRSEIPHRHRLWQQPSLTRLNLRALLLVGEELAQLRLVLVVELLQVEVLDAGLRRVHAGQEKLRVGAGEAASRASSIGGRLLSLVRSPWETERQFGPTENSGLGRDR